MIQSHVITLNESAFNFIHKKSSCSKQQTWRDFKMSSLKSLVRIVLCIGFCLQVSIADAENQNVKLIDHNKNLVPILDYLESHGVNLTYLGNQGGLNGYLGESTNGHFQTFYVTPDGNHVISGIMNNLQGINVTGVQIGEMQRRFREAEKLLLNEVELTESPETDLNLNVASGVNSTRELNAPNSTGQFSELELGKVEAVDSSDLNPLTNQQSKLNDNYTNTVGDEVSNQIASINRNLKPISQNEHHKNRFLNAVANTTYFDIGNPNAKITVWKLADPNCPYCHKAMEQIQAHIESGLVKVRIIPIGLLDGSLELVQAALLSENPSQTWLDFHNGIRDTATRDISQTELNEVNAKLLKNLKFVEDMGIKGTPYLAFVDSHGKFHSSRGLPANMDEFLLKNLVSKF